MNHEPKVEVEVARRKIDNPHYDHAPKSVPVTFRLVLR